MAANPAKIVTRFFFYFAVMMQVTVVVITIFAVKKHVVTPVGEMIEAVIPTQDCDCRK